MEHIADHESEQRLVHCELDQSGDGDPSLRLVSMRLLGEPLGDVHVRDLHTRLGVRFAPADERLCGGAQRLLVKFLIDLSSRLGDRGTVVVAEAARPLDELRDSVKTRNDLGSGAGCPSCQYPQVYEPAG